MADQHLDEGSSTSNVSSESSDAIVEINVKTLESQVYSFQVKKNMPVSSLKEKIANDVGVPVGQQRLIFRGKVLKDEHLLSEYYVENGHTLHLVVRQQAQSQPITDVSSGETSGDNGRRGNEANVNAPQGLVGQISHSVLLGSLNVADQGEGFVPDLSRVIGAVINSLGTGAQTTFTGVNNGIQFSTLSNNPSQPQQGNETVGSSGSVGSQSLVGNQPGQSSLGQPLTAAAAPVPSLNAPVPNSLDTLSEFMRRMEQTLTQNGYQPDTSSTNNEEAPRPELPSDERGLPTPEALSIVLQSAQRLFRDQTVAALSHIAGRLEQEGDSSDPNIRGQIQEESVQVGLAMQHLGSLLLELGRVILTLRMGQSPAESSVNAGPAVYISPSGPNPIMVQPFPLQTNSLFGGSVPSPTPMNMGPVGLGNTPRNINIHIHAGTALAPVLSTVGTRTSIEDRVHGERGNSTSSAELDGSDSMRVRPVRSVIAAAVPLRPTAAANSTALQPASGVSVSQRSTDISSVVGQMSSQIRNLVNNMQGENQVASAGVMSTGPNSSDGPITGNTAASRTPVNGGGEFVVSLPGSTRESEGQKPLPEGGLVRNIEDTKSVLSSQNVPSSSSGAQSSSHGESAVKFEDTLGNTSEKQELQEGANAIPHGLGPGGLERKRRPKQPKTLGKRSESETSNLPTDKNLNSTAIGQHLLRTFASSSSVMHGTDANAPSRQLPLVDKVAESKQSRGQDTDGQVNTASAMSQVSRSPELTSLLPGFSQQSGVVSPDILRNMLQQLTQSPQIMNTVNQIAQQIETQDVGNMFSGQGGGIDLSRMVQQMMPVVSQALGRGSAAQPFSSTPQLGESRSSEVDNPDNQIQIGIQQVAQRIEQLDSPGEIFRSIIQHAGRFHGNNGSREELVNELCGDEDLAHEFEEMLQRDICKRLEGDPERDGC